MRIDTDSAFGQRVLSRLREERVAWLTTVDGGGTPQPAPIWFLWDGSTILIYSRADAARLRNLARSPRVAFNFDSDGQGGNIVAITGPIEIDESVPPADQNVAYVEKYADGFRRIGTTAAAFAQDYPVALRMRPGRLRGH